MTTHVTAASVSTDNHHDPTPPSGEATPLRVVPLRHPWRWVFGFLVVFAVAQLVWTLFSNPRWRWDTVADYLFAPSIINGLWLTLWLTAVSAVLGFVLGALLALARLSASPLLRSFAWGFIWFFRSIPLVVQLVIWYNLGYLFSTIGLGWPFTYDFWIVEFNTNQLISAGAAAVLGLSLHQAAYSAEIIRAGILSVDRGQFEASAALGLPRHTRFFRIVLPQAAPAIIPNAFNEVIGLLKGTSVVFVLAIPELFYTVQVIYNRNQLVIPLLLVAVIWYTVFTTALSLLQNLIERRFARGAQRALPPTPGARLWAVIRRRPSRDVDTATHTGSPSGARA
ncbi:polar amino acid transport system permease protein [Mycetocola sp. BIGb0189]|uniref:amino acid ABC transporter permease n=1 Tax=Mycetocola sp. BIGb0189 TaxID=2940604 RepID=UPI00216A3EF4|nr:amino acid ABC transporter permease [Mycetocola sp. BIGb0189]MCS4276145.1 polar amino acid transport system permease protein [Mycetocola sp. BIGb0189]